MTMLFKSLRLRYAFLGLKLLSLNRLYQMRCLIGSFKPSNDIQFQYLHQKVTSQFSSWLLLALFCL
uniref:Putative ovule protein n=1 Tax=Solanum chacoense TaxID=4108 RepID=A0A0V0H6A3_SOLCH